MPRSIKRTRKKKIYISYFAGGCFWGQEKLFNQLKGVTKTQVGYMGGSTKNPTYEMVSSGKTGHAETVKVWYDSSLSYPKLLRYFFQIHDPTSIDSQGSDKGPQYRSIAFYSGEKQKQQYLRFVRNLTNIKTKLLPAKKFNKAEDYHQKYSFVTTCNSINTENNIVFNTICRNNSTQAEKKGSGKYLHNQRKGLYLCGCCGNELYHSKDKYESGTGWPAFSKTIREENILHNEMTKEIRCECGLHLGHRTDDGIGRNKIHDCINSTCITFRERKHSQKKETF